MTLQLPTKTKWTAQAYLEWARPDDETRYEVVGGELRTMPSPIPFHQTIIMNIAFAIKLWLRVQQIGRVYISPVDVILGEALVIPDLFFVSNKRLEIVGNKRVKGAPDLVIEVLSLSTAKRDLQEKMQIYATHGVREYWLVNPEAMTVEVLTLVDGEYESLLEVTQDEMVHSQVLAGFEVSAADIFADD